MTRKYQTTSAGSSYSTGSNAMELKVVDENSYTFAQAMDNVANELAEQNRLKREEMKLKILEIKALGKLNELDQTTLGMIMQEVGQDKA